MSDPTTTTTPTAYCRSCGKPLFEDVRRTSTGAAFCAEHFPVEASAPVTPPVPPSTTSGRPKYSETTYSARPAGFSSGSTGFTPDSSAYSAPPDPPPPADRVYTGGLGAVPPLAFLLGFIPGVGAIYNGQYAKGLIHAVIFGLMVSLISSGAGHDIEPLIGILLGAFVFYMAFEAYHTARKRRDGEPVDEFSSLVHTGGSRVPVAAVGLIAIGALLLMMTNNLINGEVFRRGWPVGLIAVGGYLLYARIKGTPSV